MGRCAPSDFDIEFGMSTTVSEQNVHVVTTPQNDRHAQKVFHGGMTWHLYIMISKGQETIAVTRLDGKSSLNHVDHLKHELAVNLIRGTMRGLCSMILFIGRCISWGCSSGDLWPYIMHNIFFCL